MNNDFEENNYGLNEFKGESNDSSKESSNPELVDIRIILTNMDYLEYISKAVGNFDLSNFNVNISSIIPTFDIEIAKNTIIGADLVLIAAESNAKGHKLYQKFSTLLKNDSNLIEYLKLPSLDELNDYEYDYEDDNIFEDEIANSIIRGGLYSISNLSSINHSKRKYNELKRNFEEESLKYDKINRENDILINESKVLRDRNEKLVEEIRILQRELDKIKSDFSDLKSRFEGIYIKNSLEVYSLNDLWYDLFNEHLSQDIYKFILISTDNFRPKNLLIGQGAICAESKEDALDWLKIIKTAFILSDTNKQDLDYNNFNSNFVFENIDEFDVDTSNKESLFEDFADIGISNFNNDSNLDDSIFSKGEKFSKSDDGFIYNERFEGNVPEDSTKVDEIFAEKVNQIERNEENINVFNLKSLQSIENIEENSILDSIIGDNEENSNIDDEFSHLLKNDDENYELKKKNIENYNYEDYENYEDYDEYDDDEDTGEEINDDSSPFSNFWN